MDDIIRSVHYLFILEFFMNQKLDPEKSFTIALSLLILYPKHLIVFCLFFLKGKKES
jgi:hypothetical protein